MTLTPPVAKRIPRTDVYHGETRVDDYFWLRDKSNPDVAAYLEAENAWADAVMAPTRGLQEKLYAEMLGRIQETDLSVPYREGGFFYYSRTEQGKQYPILCRKAGTLDGAEQVTLDLNALADGKKFMALGAFAPSDDGRLLAYSTDDTGFRQYLLQIKDLATGETLPDRVDKAVSVAWAADGRTLFYTVEDEAKRSYRVYRHVVGDTGEDVLVHEEPDERFGVYVGRSRSGACVFMASASHTTSEVRFLKADTPAGEWTLIAAREQDHEYDVEHHGDRFYIRTNDRGRTFRLVSTPVSSPGREHWQEEVPGRPDVMVEGVDCFARHLVLQEREAGLPQLRVIELATGAAHRVEMPEPVYDAFPVNNRVFDTAVLRFSYQSLVTPASVFDYDMTSRVRTLRKQQPVLGGYDAARYVSERLFATAGDGTRVPISLVRRRDLPRDGSARGYLYGYGSYGISIPIAFSSNRLSLLDRGFAFAIAHIRGGGDLGKPWHDAGRMQKKRNTFTDFIACAEHLIAEKYTSADRLAIEGGSAGGLLMGAVCNLRPELFRVVVSKVPFVDVINTMMDASLPLTAGEWEEWGDPRQDADYRHMKSYCPYTNLRAQAYPTMLVKTSFNDSQVMYWEPAKYVAKLRTLKTDDNPLLFKTNMAAGHGGASGRYDALREAAFDYAFVLSQLGITE
ncbi:MAG: S9 family peptidase [Vicinamibacteria bacterium]|nr:S9 family peptidase [Vicinamibacteria bacterium]